MLHGNLGGDRERFAHVVSSQRRQQVAAGHEHLQVELRVLFDRAHHGPQQAELGAAAGGHGERVDDPEEVPAAIERAFKAVREEKRQALLNVIGQ